MRKVFIDFEPEMFGISRMHEYEHEWSPHRWTYLSKTDDCITDMEAKLSRLKALAPNHQQVVCLGDRSNFRYSVLHSYKSNRLGVRKAAGYHVLREWLMDTFETVVLKGCEADDAVGVSAGPNDLIYSIDKDLGTIAGNHLNPDGSRYEVTELDAERAFWKQVLVGDSADGYKGCPKIGAACKLFEEEDWLTCITEKHFWDLVYSKFLGAAKELLKRHDIADPLHYCVQTARVARILRPGEYDHDTETPVLWRVPS